jgi:uncharacterized membrane protein
MARRSLLSDRRGAVAIIMASASIAMFGVVGIAIDFGNVFTARRALQGATDIAAIAAASNLSNATAAANANAVANNFQAADVASVTLGTYVADPTISPSARFQPAPLATANAVQVTMTHQQPLYFMDLLWFYHGGTSMPISTQATAAATQVVSFDLGSGTASLSGGIANAILGATVGGAVNMSLVDYQSLASAQVDLFGLANAVAVQLGQPNDSYAQAFGGTISMSNFIAALERVAPGVMPQLQVLATAAATGSATVDLSRLLEYGPYADLPVGGVEPQVTATASVMSLLQNASQVGGNTHLINLNINANIPGITAVTAMMTIGEPPVGTTVMAIDQAGASLHTAQIRLFLNITLGMVGTAAVQLPLYVEVGYGTASLASVACNALDSSSTQVTLNVTPGLVNGWIGNVTAANMTNFSSEPTPTTATLLNLLNIATVTGRANATVGNVAPVPVTFSATDIANQTIKPSSTTDFVGALITSLVGNLSLQVNVIGLPILVPPGLTSSVSSVLSAAVSPVDQLVTGILQATGLSLGIADTWVTGARCSAATLAG